MKKIFAICFVWFQFFFVQASNLQNDMLPNGNTGGIGNTGVGALTEVLVFAKNFLFSLLAIISISVFIYFGFKLIVSRGNEEDFKKALMGFLYAIMGLAIIPLAWGAVKIISTLQF